MKLVISATGPRRNDLVDARFGRARYLIGYDSTEKSYVAYDNSERVEAAQGAGVQTAQEAVALGAEAVLTGHCGPKAFDILTAAGVKIYSGCTGSVAAALQAWQDGDLELLATPDGLGRH